MHIRCEDLTDACNALWAAYEQMHHHEAKGHCKQSCACRVCNATRLVRKAWEEVAEEERQRYLNRSKSESK